MATPNASQQQMQAIFKRLENTPTKYLRPVISQNLLTKTPATKVSSLGKRAIGRSDITPVPEPMAENIREEVLIRELVAHQQLCRQALSRTPTKIILLSHQSSYTKLTKNLLPKK